MFFDFDPQNGKRLHESSPFADEPCHVNCDCGRFVEIGNNVFMQYQKTADGFAELDQKNVDFGGGLERLLAAANDIPDVFLLDIFDAARMALEMGSGAAYGADVKKTYAMRVIVDHLRAAIFLIGDGVLPSNKDQGYFVRRLIRRAVRHGHELGLAEAFTAGIAASFIPKYEDQYPSLRVDEARIIAALTAEEGKFRQTLSRGLQEFGKRIASGALTGKDAFDLYASYGFPLEMTEELATDRGITVDREAFGAEFRKHQELSRTASAGKFKGGLADHGAKVTAYHTATHLMLSALRKELGESVHQAGSNITEERTRFDFTYPEKVPRDVLDRVEATVNEAIAADATVGTTVMGKEEAKAAGVEGSFWEKYPEKVTVYEVAGQDGTVYSRELCGGPHVQSTAEIGTFGTFRIIKEEASSAGVRRVKAVLE
jgi:alanyl-tRNA synthetase